MKEYFKKFSSNSIGAGANQNFFEMCEGEVRTGLVFYRICSGGEYNYSLLFSDKIDSTFAGGERSRANLVLGGFSIQRLRIGRSRTAPVGEEEVKGFDRSEFDLESLTDITFSGKAYHELSAGETVYTDPVRLYFDEGDYMAIEITYSGKRIPCHTETVLPVYNKTERGYEYSVNMPQPLMIGCDRAVRGRICYLGDSITQGIGAGLNTYLHWTARLSNMMGNELSHYNLGIGYARAADAASLGDWLLRACSCDTVFVCLGTNDIGTGLSEKAVISSLKAIICKLKSSNCRIILQTLPPFNREGEREATWENINRIIKSELRDEVLSVFDVVPLLSESEEKPGRARYGGHPNAEGCRIWAEALYKETNKYFE